MGVLSQLEVGAGGRGRGRGGQKTGQVRFAGVPRHGTAHPRPGRGPVQGVAALSPCRDAAPATSVQVPALTPAASCCPGLTAGRHSESHFGSSSRGCYAEAEAEEAPNTAPPLRPAGANRSSGPPRTRPACRPRAHAPRPLAPIPASRLQLLVPALRKFLATYSSDWRASGPHKQGSRLLAANRVWRRFKEIGNGGASSGAQTRVTLGRSPHL